jgi:hypothetical protein
MYAKVITAEVRASGLPGAAAMTPTKQTLDWVDQGYQTLLDRPGEPSGVAYWAYQVTKNGWTNQQLQIAMSQGAISSGEAIHTVGTVESGRVQLVPGKILKDDGTYVSTASTGVVLGNNIEINGPNSMGHTTYGTPTGITQNQNGTTTAGAGASIQGKDLTSESFVTNLYATVFERTPDAGGLAYWVEKLESKTLDIQQVRDYFITSPEGQLRGVTAAAEALQW